MTDRIKTKIYNAFTKYKTDCIIATVRAIRDGGERRALIMRTEINELNLIMNTGIVFSLDGYGLLYVRDMRDVAYEGIFNKEYNND